MIRTVSTRSCMFDGTIEAHIVHRLLSRKKIGLDGELPCNRTELAGLPCECEE